MKIGKTIKFFGILYFISGIILGIAFGLFLSINIKLSYSPLFFVVFCSFLIASSFLNAINGIFFGNEIQKFLNSLKND